MSTLKKVLYSIEDIVARNSDNMYVWENEVKRISMIPFFLCGRIVSFDVTLERKDVYPVGGIRAAGNGWHVYPHMVKRYRFVKQEWINVEDLHRYRDLAPLKFEIAI